MCQPSKVADDWVVKGCHIHVNGVELVMRPTYDNQILFMTFFSSSEGREAEEAIRHAESNCLQDPTFRESWSKSLERARLHMLGYEGDGPLKALANGRMFEFRRLVRILERYET